MAEEQMEDVLRRAWAEQPVPAPPPPLEALKRRAGRARLQFAIRNAVEYAAVLTVLGMAGVRVVTAELLLMRTGNALLALGMIYLMVQLHLRASARRPPPDGTAYDYLLFLRIELARQAQALRTVWRWYLLPFVPGLLVIYTAMALEEPDSRWYLRIAVFGAILVAAHFLNRLAAARLTRRLADLEAAVREENQWERSPADAAAADRSV